MRDDPFSDPDALRSRKREVILTNHVVLRLYAALGEDARARVRDMLATASTGSCDVTDALDGMPGITGAQISVSDSVAKAELEFVDGTILRESRLILRQVLPDTMRQGLRGGKLTDIVRHPLLKGFACHGIEGGADHTVLRFDWGVATMHETPRDVPLQKWRM